jgi:hypothetical protein
VPKRISYDNSKIPVAKIVGKRERELTDAFLKLKSHYLFQSHFCLVRRPNEKGQVECLVGFTRRNFLVPLPRVADFETLNTELERKCREDLDRRLRGKATTKLQRLTEERSAMLELPKQSYEARRVEQRRADSLSLVRFDRNSYSIPVAYAHRPVTVVAGIDEVRLVVDGQLVAKHRRNWSKEHTEYDPIHYLALLERKPGALDFARPCERRLKNVAFWRFRRSVEKRGALGCPGWFSGRIMVCEALIRHGDSEGQQGCLPTWTNGQRFGGWCSSKAKASGACAGSSKSTGTR